MTTRPHSPHRRPLARLLTRLPAPFRRMGRRVLEALWQGQGAEVLGQTLRVLPENTPYSRWLTKARRGMPVFEGLVVDDVRTVAVEAWPAMGSGVKGLYVKLADYEMTDTQILEIPPDGATAPRQHLFEAAICYLGGPGHTIIEPPGKPPQRIDWNDRSLYSVPLNVRYHHVNDGDSPVRLLTVTSFPFVINATDDEAFVFENPFDFVGRRTRSDARQGQPFRTGRLATALDLVPDAAKWALEKDEYRGAGNTNMGWEMSSNSMLSIHASEMPARRHKKAHRHSSDAFILLLSGNGYSVTWPDGAYEKRIRVDWKDGTLFVPPTYWYHQHFNPGSEPARYLAVSARGLTKNLGLRFSDQLEADLPELAAEWRRELHGVEE